MKEGLIKPVGSKLGVSRIERTSNSLRFGVLVLASLFAGYVATWIGLNIASEYPLEFRENAVFFTAELQNRGANPYSIEHRPLHANVYGIGYYWVCYPFTRLLGCHYTVLRVVSCCFIVASCCLLVWALRGDGVSWGFAVVGALFLFVQLGQGLSIVARPDGLGLFLFLASLVIPHRFHFSPSALFCGALLAMLGFLTKPYFLLSLGLVSAHLFLFESKLKAVVFSVLAALGIVLVAWAMNLLYECYFTEVFFASLGSASRSWAHLAKTGGSFLAQNSSLLLILAAGLVRYVASGRADVRAGAHPTAGRHRINWTQFRQPLVSCRGELPGLVLVCNSAVMVLILGLHQGNDILYYHQLITPFLLWIVVRLADVTFKRHWLAGALLSVNLLVLWACAAPLPRDHSAQWRALESLVASKSEVFAAPHLALLAQRTGRTVYDTGQTEYAFAADRRNFTRVADEYQERARLFLHEILDKMRTRQFDLIVINAGACPLLPLEELGRYYVPKEVLAAPMTFDSFLRKSPLICWVPNEGPRTTTGSGVKP